MKKILFYILLFGSTLTWGQTNTFVSLIDTNLVWYINHDIYPHNLHLSWQHNYRFIGADTVINNETYHLLHRQGIAHDGSSIYDYYISENTDGKNYLLHQSQNKYLLYDFGAGIGDTLYRDSTNTVYYYVYDKEVITVDNTLRRKLYIHTNWLGPFGSPDFVWVEGIGNDYGGVLSHFAPDVGFGMSLCGVEKNGVRIYPDAIGVCHSGFNGIENLDNTLSVYPVPANDYLIISENILPEATCNIYNIEGKIIASEIVSGNQISLKNINNGIYFLSITLKNGNIFWKKFIKQ